MVTTTTFTGNVVGETIVGETIVGEAMAGASTVGSSMGLLQPDNKPLISKVPTSKPLMRKAGALNNSIIIAPKR
jgi:hypothetical protein